MSSYKKRKEMRKPPTNSLYELMNALIKKERGYKKMGYISKIDQKATIRVAKDELNEFSNLISLSKVYGELSSFNYSLIQNESSYVNYDAIMLSNIENKDEQMVEIEKKLVALNMLDSKDLELLWMKHINKKQNDEICSILKIEKSSLYRKLRMAYIRFAIVYKIVVLKKNE